MQRLRSVLHRNCGHWRLGRGGIRGLALLTIHLHLVDNFLNHCHYTLCLEQFHDQLILLFCLSIFHFRYFQESIQRFALLIKSLLLSALFNKLSPFRADHVLGAFYQRRRSSAGATCGRILTIACQLRVLKLILAHQVAVSLQNLTQLCCGKTMYPSEYDIIKSSHYLA